MEKNNKSSEEILSELFTTLNVPEKEESENVNISNDEIDIETKAEDETMKKAKKKSKHGKKKDSKKKKKKSKKISVDKSKHKKGKHKNSDVEFGIDVVDVESDSSIELPKILKPKFKRNMSHSSTSKSKSRSKSPSKGKKPRNRTRSKSRSHRDSRSHSRSRRSRPVSRNRRRSYSRDESRERDSYYSSSYSRRKRYRVSSSRSPPYRKSHAKSEITKVDLPLDPLDIWKSQKLARLKQNSILNSTPITTEPSSSNNESIPLLAVNETQGLPMPLVDIPLPDISIITEQTNEKPDPLLIPLPNQGKPSTSSVTSTNVLALLDEIPIPQTFAKPHPTPIPNIIKSPPMTSLTPSTTPPSNTPSATPPSSTHELDNKVLLKATIPLSESQQIPSDVSHDKEEISKDGDPLGLKGKGIVIKSLKDSVVFLQAQEEACKKEINTQVSEEIDEDKYNIVENLLGQTPLVEHLSNVEQSETESKDSSSSSEDESSDEDKTSVAGENSSANEDNEDKVADKIVLSDIQNDTESDSFTPPMQSVSSPEIPENMPCENTDSIVSKKSLATTDVAEIKARLLSSFVKGNTVAQTIATKTEQEQDSEENAKTNENKGNLGSNELMTDDLNGRTSDDLIEDMLKLIKSSGQFVMDPNLEVAKSKKDEDKTEYPLESKDKFDNLTQNSTEETDKEEKQKKKKSKKDKDKKKEKRHGRDEDSSKRKRESKRSRRSRSQSSEHCLTKRQKSRDRSNSREYSRKKRRSSSHERHKSSRESKHSRSDRHDHRSRRRSRHRSRHRSKSRHRDRSRHRSKDRDRSRHRSGHRTKSVEREKKLERSESPDCVDSLRDKVLSKFT